MTHPVLKLRNLCIILSLSASSYAFAHEMEMPAQCNATESIAYPVSDLPGPKDLRALIACDPAGLYYGATGPGDYMKARHCAYTMTSATFQNQGILAMLYANGKGVDKSYALARKAACGASSDAHEVVELLDKLETAVATATTFDVCQDVRGESLTAGCALIDANRKADTRSAELSRLTSGWTEQELVAFRALMDALARFSEAHAASELVAGRYQAARSIALMVQTDDRFLSDLKRVDTQAQSAYAEAQLRNSEQELKLANTRVLKAAAAVPQAGLSTDRLLKSHQAWAAYCAAWVQFGRVRYPKVAASAFIGELTDVRVTQLKQLEKDILAAR